MRKWSYKAPEISGYLRKYLAYRAEARTGGGGLK